MLHISAFARYITKRPDHFPDDLEFVEVRSITLVKRGLALQFMRESKDDKSGRSVSDCVNCAGDGD